MAYSDKRIKEYLGHNGGECRVKIKRNGEIERYGSTDPFDRSKDYWALVGTRETVVREMIHRDAESGIATMEKELGRLLMPRR